VGKLLLLLTCTPHAHCSCALASCTTLQLFVLRKVIEHNLRAANLSDDECYFCSLSSKTLVYKGQLTPLQVHTQAIIQLPPCCSIECGSCSFRA
jgi:hypothetical protein